MAIDKTFRSTLQLQMHCLTRLANESPLKVFLYWGIMNSLDINLSNVMWGDNEDPLWQ